MSGDEQRWLLRIEAVNLGTFITDSDDLSTIRGAGLLVLGIHQHLTDWSADRGTFGNAGLFRINETSPSTDPMNEDLKWSLEVDPGSGPQKVVLDLISAGASIAIYSFCSPAEVAAALRNQVDDCLRRHPRLRDATFSVETGTVDLDGANFVSASENVLRKVRRRQLRGSTVAISTMHGTSDLPSAGMCNRFCDIDGKRAAVVDLKKQLNSGDQRTSYAKAVDKNFASSATSVRRQYGRDTKIRVYHMIGSEDSTAETAQKLAAFTPTWELQDIAARSDRRIASERKAEPDPFARLAGKIAVIYIDGNKFAKQIQQRANSIVEYKKTDRLMLAKRRVLMRSLVEHMQSEGRPYWKVNKPEVDQQPGNERFRIETLMWGGDELVWVVPAWCGLETVKFFFEHSKDWTLTGGSDEPKLTHAVGMVLCSHKSPIRSVVSLAKALAESAKQAIVPTEDDAKKTPYYNEPSSNCLAYQVLESFDHIGDDFDAARERHRFASMTGSEAVLSSSCLRHLIDHMNQLKHDIRLPRTRLHQLASLLKTEELPVDTTKESLNKTHYGKLIARISETVRPDGVASNEVISILNAPLDWGQTQSLSAKWYHVIELWDYLSSLDSDIMALYTKQALQEGKS